MTDNLEFIWDEEAARADREQKKQGKPDMQALAAILEIMEATKPNFDELRRVKIYRDPFTLPGANLGKDKMGK